MNLVESLDQLSSASAKKAKKAKKQHFNDGMIDAGDREAKKPFHSSTGLAVAVMYNVLIFAYAWYTKNYLVMMLFNLKASTSMAPDVFVNMTIMANATEDFMKIMTLLC
ncbi:unnamed protein product [Pocillopora meandrina]|uniref:Uncharacterized protein n=1 Tax=Pocillopora meandrina TaxID=46732 RepID=A0AAU9XH01_9CNID|nr:unnamed protein product [Pocillopora meandrina]